METINSTIMEEGHWYKLSKSLDLRSTSLNPNIDSQTKMVQTPLKELQEFFLRTFLKSKLAKPNQTSISKSKAKEPRGPSTSCIGEPIM